MRKPKTKQLPSNPASSFGKQPFRPASHTFINVNKHPEFLAHPWERLIARAIDLVLMTVGYVVMLFVALLVIYVIEGRLGNSEITDSGATLTTPQSLQITFNIMLIVIMAGVGVVYEVASTALSGRTLGKRILGIRVIQATTGNPPGWPKSFLRWLLPVLSMLIPVGFIVTYARMLWNKKNQSYHDSILKTLVVKT